MFSVRSVDRYEMWGPSDTIERLQYNNKDLDLSFKWLCKEPEDYLKVNWMVEQLNKKKVSLSGLNKALKSLTKTWDKIKYKMYVKRWEDMSKKEKCPFKKKQYIDNIRIQKINNEAYKKEEKWNRLKSKIEPIDLAILSGHVKGLNRVVSAETIKYYNKIKKYKFELYRE